MSCIGGLYSLLSLPRSIFGGVIASVGEGVKALLYAWSSGYDSRRSQRQMRFALTVQKLGYTCIIESPLKINVTQIFHEMCSRIVLHLLDIIETNISP